MPHYIKNLLREWDQSTPQDKNDGMMWYKRVRDRCRQLADKHGKSLEQVAAVYAVLSPGVQWAVNDRDAEGLLISGEGYKVATYTANKRKAIEILDHGKSIEDVTTKDAKKVRAFYKSIMTGGETVTVCIDRHIGAIVKGRQLTDTERKTLRRKRYDAISKAVVKAAEMVDLPAAMFQAVIWTSYRRRLERELREVTPF